MVHAYGSRLKLKVVETTSLDEAEIIDFRIMCMYNYMIAMAITDNDYSSPRTSIKYYDQ